MEATDGSFRQIFKSHLLGRLWLDSERHLVNNWTSVGSFSQNMLATQLVHIRLQTQFCALNPLP